MNVEWMEWLNAARDLRPQIAIVLGSGLDDVTSRVVSPSDLPFVDVPDWPRASVVGHAGCLRVGTLAGVGVLLIRGRFHHYEGHPALCVTAPVRLAADLGVRIFIATNAAGGIRADLNPGSIMVLTDHRYWRTPQTMLEPLSASPYSTRLQERLIEGGRSLGLEPTRGVYGNVTGPSYETAAEIRAMLRCGIDAVGMSTAPEIDAAHAQGMECAAISCITNLGTGQTKRPHAHADVVAVAGSRSRELAQLLEEFVTDLEGPRH